VNFWHRAAFTTAKGKRHRMRVVCLQRVCWVGFVANTQAVTAGVRYIRAAQTKLRVNGVRHSWNKPPSPTINVLIFKPLFVAKRSVQSWRNLGRPF
jgi:hypothetical protein